MFFRVNESFSRIEGVDRISEFGWILKLENIVEYLLNIMC